MRSPYTKIVATIGPSTWEDEVLLEMLRYGFCVARINASFADHEELDRVATQLRRLSPRVALMLDTMGHKIRVTGFSSPIDLVKGDEIILVSEQFKTNDKAIKVTYNALHKDVTRNTRILLDDGNIELTVRDIDKEKVICTVMDGGRLEPRKTVNIPGTYLSFKGLSEKDEADIKYAVNNNFDFISASFIKRIDDVKEIRRIMGKSKTKLIAKIENQEGVDNFDAILEGVDAIMIARGDLGVEVAQEKLPILQKMMIYKCRSVGKPVIVATQMLESMRKNKKPTRAEVSDVANAIMDGTDAIMLSAETSTGSYPAEAVRTMYEISQEVEPYLQPQMINDRSSASETTDVLCRHIFTISKELNIKGVIVFSKTGRSVLSLARHRLSIPIWSISSNPTLIRQQQIVRGVTGLFLSNISKDRDDAVKQAVEAVYGKGDLELDDKVAVLSGSAIANKDTNSILEIVQIKDVLLKQVS
jgi:pyruvate kinase